MTLEKTQASTWSRGFSVPQSIERTRLPKLDSIRGVASLMVVAGHCAGAAGEGFQSGSPWRWAGIFFDAADAVAFFFILSGYVLALQQSRDPGLTYVGFLTRRFFRIWPPFAAAMILAYALLRLSVLLPINGVAWQMIDPAGATLPALLANLLMTGDSRAINGPIWSLFVEMRIAFAFPLIMALATRANPGVSIAVSLVYSILASRLSHAPWAVAADIAQTSRFLFLFAIGAALAVKSEVWALRYRELSVAQKSAWLMVALGLIEYRFAPATLPARNYIPTIGVAILFWLLLYSSRAERILERPRLLFFGRISYGVYLIHYPILSVATAATTPAAAIAIVLASSVALGWLIHEYAEKPSIKLGQALSRRL